MMDKATATGWVRELESRQLDAVVGPLGFGRTVRGTTYSRKVEQGRQHIYVDIKVRPYYSPEDVHVMLRCSVSFPRIRAVLVEWEPEFWGRGSSVDAVVLDAIVRNPPMMLFQTREELEGLVPTVTGHLRNAVLPYLEERASMEQFAVANLNSWMERPVPGGTSHVGLLAVAGYLALGQAERAARTFDICYPEGTRGRERYAHVVGMLERAVGG